MSSVIRLFEVNVVSNTSAESCSITESESGKRKEQEEKRDPILGSDAMCDAGMRTAGLQTLMTACYVLVTTSELNGGKEKERAEKIHNSGTKVHAFSFSFVQRHTHSFAFEES